MFIDIPLEVELVPGLVIRRRIDVVERDAERTRDLEPRLGVEVGVGSPDVDGRPVQTEKRNPIGVIDSSRDGAGYDHVPVTIALLPTQQGRHRGVPDTPGGLGETARDGISQRTGHWISDARDEGPQSASGRSAFPAETANGPLHPSQTAENRGCSAETGNSGLAQDCVVGPGGLEPATRRLSALAGKFRCGTHKHGIEEGRRKDWHSAANRAVVSSSWGDYLSRILPRRLDAEAGL